MVTARFDIHIGEEHYSVEHRRRSSIGLWCELSEMQTRMKVFRDVIFFRGFPVINVQAWIYELSVKEDASRQG